MNAPPRPLDVMALLEAAVRSSSARFGADARRIRFSFPTGDWTFEPQAPARHFVASALPDPALTLWCTPAQLHRMVTEAEFVLAKGETLRFAGDPEALAPLVKALGGAAAGSAS